ncbi:MFS transporter [Mycetocola sp. 2940]|uniref:MFS transporter n=1 Tax=Mycetocola sp. 2940 TaxID=3156452 RepID=UPI0033937B12
MAASADAETRGIVARQRKPLYSLLAAESVGQIGNNMTLVAGPWFVLETTGSAALTGLVGAALALGAVLPAVLGGPLVDRLGFKRASVLADIVSAVAIGAVPVLHLMGVLELWHLLLLVFALSSINAQGDTARYALIPTLAQWAGTSTERANAVDRACVRLGQVVGPVLAGILITVFGATNVLLIDAGTFLASATLVALGVPSRANSAERAPLSEGGGSYTAALAEGLRFVRSSKLLLSMVLLAALGNFLDKPLMAVIAPVYAETVFGSPTSLGIVLGAFGAGALAGSLLYGAVGRRWPRRRTFLLCYLLGPLVIYGTLALAPTLGWVVLAAAMCGLLFGPVNPIIVTVIQDRTPPQMLGRAFGALIAIGQAGIPLGAVLAGVAIQAIGLIPTIVAMGTLYLTVSGAMFFNRSLRGMDLTPDLPKEAQPQHAERHRDPRTGST